MHELSIAMGIVKISDKELQKSGKTLIEEIELEIGELSGVEMDALEFVWPSAVKGSSLEHARRKISRVPGTARCIDCDSDYKINNHYDSCPNCGSVLKNILKGRELRVKSLLVS